MIKNGVKVLIVVVIIGMIAGGIGLIGYLVKENGRLRDNSEILLSETRDEMLALTRKELKSYYEGIIDTLNSYGVRTRNVENIVRVSYKNIDTTVVREEVVYVYDSNNEVLWGEFLFEDRCYTIGGIVYGDSVVELNRREYHDSIMIALYKKRRFFRKPKYKAIAVSSCMGDTIQVIDNIKVVKR